MISVKSLFILGAFCLWQGESCYESGWSSWINDYKPSSELFLSEKMEAGIKYGGGDIENMNQTERKRFCASGHGSITAIECATVNGTKYSTTGQLHLDCSTDTGFKCSNRLAGSLCLDYKIRLYCSCSSPLTLTAAIPPALQSKESGVHGQGSNTVNPPGQATNGGGQGSGSGLRQGLGTENGSPVGQSNTGTTNLTSVSQTMATGTIFMVNGMSGRQSDTSTGITTAGQGKGHTTTKVHSSGGKTTLVSTSNKNKRKGTRADTRPRMSLKVKDGNWFLWQQIMVLVVCCNMIAQLFSGNAGIKVGATVGVWLTTLVVYWLISLAD